MKMLYNRVMVAALYCAFGVAISGCANIKPLALTRDQAEKIQSVQVDAILLSDLPSFQDFSGNSLQSDENKLDFVAFQLSQNPGIVPAGGGVLAAGIAGAVAGGVVAALTYNESAARYEQETRSLVPTFYASLDSKVAKDLLSGKLEALTTELHDIRVERYGIATPSKRLDASKGGKTAVLTIGFEQMVPPDFSSLRIKMRAEARDADGNTIFSQNFYYLPSMELPGSNKAERVAAWGANDSKVYRDEFKRGMNALLGALDVVFLSYRSLPDEAVLPSAKAALADVHCYVRDYLVPIPAGAFKDGKLLADGTKGYKAIRLANNEILTFPNCS